MAELSKAEIEKIVGAIMQADGEDVQEILSLSGNEQQMLQQLMMSMPIEWVRDIYREREEFEDLKRND